MRLDNKTREIIKTEVASQLGTEKEARYLERTANRLNLLNIDLPWVESTQAWIEIRELRNRLVHEYMNVDMTLVFTLIVQEDYQFIVDFLREPISI